jgi:sodium/hydrogen antiporter
LADGGRLWVSQMTALLCFAVTLAVGVLLSGVARRTVLSLVVLFLAAGFVASLLGAIDYQPRDSVVRRLAEFALFGVLFADGQKLSLSELRGSWRLPARAMLIAMPLTFAFTALAAHYLVQLRWNEAFLLGAVLTPTDPVFASALIGHPDVPASLRRALNVESGLNDGLALPAVVILLASVTSGDVSVPVVIGEAALGLAVGVAAATAACLIERFERLSPTPKHAPLYALSVALLVLALSSAVSGNEFLAAFAAGVTLVALAPHLARAFERFGELLTEILKLGAVFIFGALISPASIADVGWHGWAFVAFALVAARPVAMLPATLGAGLSRQELIAVSWFGPKGFASVLYGLLVLASGAPDASVMFHLTALIIAASMIAHSSTDIVVAGWFESHEDAEARPPRGNREHLRA